MPSFLKQYGERRTGTNYLRFLVQANFHDVAVLMHVLGDKHGPPSPFDALWRQAQCCADPAREFVWRATFEPPWRALADEAGRREVVRLAAPVAAAFAAGELGFLLSVKNPYAWALSLRRFLRWPAPAPARLARACQRFNEVHGAWLELSRQRPCCVVRHEHLVDDPEGVLRTVGARFGLRRRDAALEDAHERMSAQFWDDTPIETTGEPFDRGYYREHRYLQELGATERDVVTRAIDWSLLEPFGYAPEPPAPGAGVVPRAAPALRTRRTAGPPPPSASPPSASPASVPPAGEGAAREASGPADPPPFLSTSPPSPESPPERWTLPWFRGRHAGETIVVCGCGASLSTLRHPERFITIGVNDVGRLFHPDYLVVLNAPRQFRDDRWRHVAESRARAVFSHLDLPLEHAPVVRFRLGRRGGTGLDDPSALPYTRNSPYVAVALAIHMGARRIGLIGVDFTDHHFFGPTGRHPLIRSLPRIDDEYGRLHQACVARGIELVNLSAESRLTSLPRMSPDAFARAGGPVAASGGGGLDRARGGDFIADAPAIPGPPGETDGAAHGRGDRAAAVRIVRDAGSSGGGAEGGKGSAPAPHAPRPPGAGDGGHLLARALRIVSYATTPVVGVPAILARAVSAVTPHACRTVWSDRAYRNGAAFEGDVEYLHAPRAAAELLDAADVVIVHNGKVAPEHAALLRGKAVVTVAHQGMWNVDQRWVDDGFPGVVVAQYVATLPEFAGWAAVPNPVPLWEPAYQPGEKSEPVTLCYTPAVKLGSYPPGHRLYSHGKGYGATLAVLDRLAAEGGVRLEVVRGRPVAHAESLAMKRRSHIVIDECVTGGYHRNSLEGLAAGAVVVNGVGTVPGVAELLRRCTRPDAPVPFVSATLDDLEAVLRSLLARGETALREEGLRSRRWMEAHWDFRAQWTRFWEPALARALEHARRPRAPAAVPAAAVVEWPGAGGSVVEAAPPFPRPPAVAAGMEDLTVVIPHGGGARRLRNLRWTLARLREAGVREGIVVELGPRPAAREHALAAGFRHVRAEGEGGFHKTRAMNVAIPLVRTTRFLWLDADIAVGADFLRRALDEMERRELDVLVPWTSVRYLDALDTAGVLAGTLDPAGCRPVNVLYSANGASGGALLLRTDFVKRYGGMCEEFRGWGYEDGAFMARARVLGRAGATEREDAHLHHAHHGGGGPRSNPRLEKNAALVAETRALRTPRAMLDRFPVPAHFTPPWLGTRRIAGAPGAEEVVHALAALYGPAVSPCGPDDAPDAVARPDPSRTAYEAAVELACALVPAPSAPPAGPADPPRPRRRRRAAAGSGVQ